jgi:hypothetical protein
VNYAEDAVSRGEPKVAKTAAKSVAPLESRVSCSLFDLL